MENELICGINLPIRVSIYDISPSILMLLPSIQDQIGKDLRDFLLNFIQDIDVKYINGDRYQVNVMGDYTTIPKALVLTIYGTEFTFNLIT